MIANTYGYVFAACVYLTYVGALVVLFSLGN